MALFSHFRRLQAFLAICKSKPGRRRGRLTLPCLPSLFRGYGPRFQDLFAGSQVRRGRGLVLSHGALGLEPLECRRMLTVAAVDEFNYSASAQLSGLGTGSG